jgi:hypothetical protein
MNILHWRRFSGMPDRQNQKSLEWQDDTPLRGFRDSDEERWRLIVGVALRGHPHVGLRFPTKFEVPKDGLATPREVAISFES